MSSPVAVEESAPHAPATASRRKTAVVLRALSVVVGLVFIYFGLVKTEDPVIFLKQLKQYEMFPLDPPHLINTTAVVLPWLEVLLGLCLVTGFCFRAAATISGAMLVVFTTAIFLRAVNFPDYVAEAITFWQIQFDCGCGAGEVTVWKKLLENSAMALVTIPAAFLCRPRRV